MDELLKLWLWQASYEPKPPLPLPGPEERLQRLARRRFARDVLSLMLVLTVVVASYAAYLLSTHRTSGSGRDYRVVYAD
ncbi:hypothetical protein CH340_04680 [Rhodoplanes serenus]|nr:hypothetical protein CH340_04680 [Rhodoplanes serenus]